MFEISIVLKYIEDISCLVTVTVEEDQINTPTCSPGAFIRQLIKEKFLSWLFQKAGLGSLIASLFWLPRLQKKPCVTGP